MIKTILSLFDYTGNWCKPYKDNFYDVIQVDIKHGIDIMKFDYSILNVYGILASIPCTDFALSGAKHFHAKDNDGRTTYSNMLVDKTKEIIDNTKPVFWVIENPMSRIHSIHKWLGAVKHKFNPCDYAGYNPINPDSDRYNKQTWLWGNFNIPRKKRLEPLQKAYPGFTNLGGKSERTKTLRSVTPLGFAYAFYDVNK